MSSSRSIVDKLLAKPSSAAEEDKNKLNRMQSAESYFKKYGEFSLNKYGINLYDHISYMNYNLNVLGVEPTAEECLYAGMGFSMGIDVRPNAKNAIYWLSMASEMGNAEAKFLLSGYYIDGIGVERSLVVGLKLLTEAVRLGSQGAKEYLDGLQKSMDGK